MVESTDLRYPIGKLQDQPSVNKGIYNEKDKESYILDIRMCPSMLEHAILNLDEHQLNTPYRPDGWTIKQVIHHVADSHMNAYCRFRFALTEHNPSIKGYDEAAWAELPDAKTMPVNISLTLLHALHQRWCNLMESMTEADWNRTFYHSGYQKTMVLYTTAATYAWHGKHHTAHITKLRERMGW